MGNVSVQEIAERIVVLRGLRVMVDSELALLYRVTTKRLNEQVKRNRDRFPDDFMFQLNAKERDVMWSQIATTLQRSRRADNLPFAFTEHGCLMLANVLRSPRAVEVSVLIVRAFVRLRGVLAANAELAARVDKLGTELEKHGSALATHETAILKLLAEIRQLTRFPESTQRGIGFTADLEKEKPK